MTASHTIVAALAGLWLVCQPQHDGLGAWLAWHVVRPGLPSILAAIPGLIGYRLIGLKRPAGWLWNLVSQALLVVTAFVSQQYGLLVVFLYAQQGVRNWWRWRRDGTAAAEPGPPPWLVPWLLDERRRLRLENDELRALAAARPMFQPKERKTA